MDRISLSDAQRDLPILVDRVVAHGISVELEREKRVVARLSPVRDAPTLKVRDFRIFLQSLPRLSEDATKFSEDVKRIRKEFPSEASPWD
jgi:antitoxin (DNA-binding transcriptional repressor) of toxin-antitoxin stability system